MDSNPNMRPSFLYDTGCSDTDCYMRRSVGEGVSSWLLSLYAPCSFLSVVWPGQQLITDTSTTTRENAEQSNQNNFRFRRALKLAHISRICSWPSFQCSLTTAAVTQNNSVSATWEHTFSSPEFRHYFCTKEITTVSGSRSYIDPLKYVLGVASILQLTSPIIIGPCIWCLIFPAYYTDVDGNLLWHQWFVLL